MLDILIFKFNFKWVNAQLALVSEAFYENANSILNQRAINDIETDHLFRIGTALQALQIIVESFSIGEVTNLLYTYFV